jgi:DNA-binding transcriptional MerR regulator
LGGDRPELPDKQYFKIGEVARLAGVAPSVLRFWETQFGWLKPEKSATNQRRYTRKQLERVLDIKELLYERGYTIAGARRHLASHKATKQSRDSLLEILEKEVRELLQLVDE